MFAFLTCVDALQRSSESYDTVMSRIANTSRASLSTFVDTGTILALRTSTTFHADYCITPRYECNMHVALYVVVSVSVSGVAETLLSSPSQICWWQCRDDFAYRDAVGHFCAHAHRIHTPTCISVSIPNEFPFTPRPPSTFQGSAPACPLHCIVQCNYRFFYRSANLIHII